MKIFVIVLFLLSISAKAEDLRLTCIVNGLVSDSMNSNINEEKISNETITVLVEEGFLNGSKIKRITTDSSKKDLSLVLTNRKIIISGGKEDISDQSTSNTFYVISTVSYSDGVTVYTSIKIDRKLGTINAVNNYINPTTSYKNRVNFFGACEKAMVRKF
jgi:hypothetical protein